MWIAVSEEKDLEEWSWGPYIIRQGGGLWWPFFMNWRLPDSKSNGVATREEAMTICAEHQLKGMGIKAKISLPGTNLLDKP